MQREDKINARQTIMLLLTVARHCLYNIMKWFELTYMKS